MNTAMRCAAHMRMRMAHMRSARETATVSLRPGVLSPQIFTTRSLSSPVEPGEPKDVVGQPTSKSTVWVRSPPSVLDTVMVVNVLW